MPGDADGDAAGDTAAHGAADTAADTVTAEDANATADAEPGRRVDLRGLRSVGGNHK